MTGMRIGEVRLDGRGEAKLLDCLDPGFPVVAHRDTLKSAKVCLVGPGVD